LNWREVYGILIGYLSEGKVFVEDAIPMVVGERAGVKFEAKQYVDLASIDASVFEKTTRSGRTSFVCGWWHTHPGFGFFFSEVDKMTHLGYQISNPSAVGLIFDHTQLGAYDCGLECLKLVNPEALYSADHTLLVFALENCDDIIKTLPEWVEKVSKKLKPATRDIKLIEAHMRKKEFAQLQRNYGLLLVPKRLTKDEKHEALGEDEDMWVWDEKYLETMYRIPVFRKQVERLLKIATNRKKRKVALATAKKVLEILKRPQEILDDITWEFWSKLDSIANVYSFLDTNERQILEMFDLRLRDYAKILYELVFRANQILESEGARAGQGIELEAKAEAEAVEEQVLESAPESPVETAAIPRAISLPIPVKIPTTSLSQLSEPTTESRDDRPPEIGVLGQLEVGRKDLIKKALESKNPPDDAEDGLDLIEKALGNLNPDEEVEFQKDTGESLPEGEYLDNNPPSAFFAENLIDAEIGEEIPSSPMQIGDEETGAGIEISESLEEEIFDDQFASQEAVNDVPEDDGNLPTPLFEETVDDSILRTPWKQRPARKVKPRGINNPA
jgi:proteasome lid subunit RPN8/RPN11